jgi:4-diphosphocytidyl-2C-methyl-D-erythritol kinase
MHLARTGSNGLASSGAQIWNNTCPEITSKLYQNLVSKMSQGSKNGEFWMSGSGSLGLSLEPARAKWTVKLQGHKARGQSARTRSSQMDIEALSFLDKFPVRSSLHFLPFFVAYLGW